MLGLGSFWFLQVSSLIFVYIMRNYFLSGHMIPLDWLPPSVNAWVIYLPFKYLAYFPASIMLGHYTHAELVNELLIAAGWILILAVANRVMFARGVRRYGAFGG